ncbi:MAG: dodecin domain-containing protein [Candidatus Methanofastidiosa archaeon]|nr:dodecin domain-containing protein [Candidatus Methanofastidiosa archaeon]
MSVIKVIETVCTSDKSWQDAVENGVHEASKTLRDIVGLDVIGWKAHVKNGKITEYRVDVKFAIKVEEGR